jgi:hypothetical protein
MKINKYIIILITIFLFAFFLSPQDTLLVKGERKSILIFPYKKYIDFTIEYTHSVEKTSTSETFRANSGKENIVLLSTKFAGQGAGLPCELDRNFKQLDNYFLVDHIDKDIEKFYVRSSVIAKYNLTINNKVILLYKIFKDGELLEFKNVKYFRIKTYLLQLYSKFMF